MSIKILFLISVLNFSMVPLVEELPPHKKYFSYYLGRFHEYYSTHFYDFENEFSRELFLKESAKIKHWKTYGESNFLWGIGLSKRNEVLYTFLYPGQNSGSIEVNANNKIKCTRTSERLVCGSNVLQRIHLEKIDNVAGFPLHPEGQFIFKDFVKKVIVYKNDEGEPVRLDYFLNDVQAEWLPKKLRKIVYKVGYDTRLPLDKISVTKKGDTFVFYP